MKRLKRTSGRNGLVVEYTAKFNRFYRYCLITASLFFLINNYVNAQCGYNNTLNTTWAAPIAIGDSVYTDCIYGGEFIRVTGMVAGETYVVSTCGNTSFDSQISIYTAGGATSKAYSDDYCGTQSQIVFTPDISGDFDILVNQYNCTVNSICAYLVVKKMPCPGVTGNYSVSPTTICPNTEVYFQAWGDASSYLWDFGDGSPSSTNPYNYHTYTSLGSYTASVTMTSACGSDTTFYQTVDVVNTIPVTDVYSSVYPSPVCPNVQVNFDAWGYGPIYTYLWDFGDGSPTSASSYASHFYSSVGSYTASVTVTNTCGNDTILSQPVLVEVNNSPVTDVYFNISPNPVCPNTNVSFDAWGYSGNYSYLWDFGDGSPASTSSYTYHTYASAGDYLASVKITNDCGKDTTLSQIVNVGTILIPVTNVYFDISPNPVCPNTEVIFSAWGSGGSNSYLWDFGDGSPTSTYSYSYHTYTSAGSFPASVTITNTCGNDTTLSQIVDVGINTLPVTNVYSNIYPSTACPNTQLTFDAWGYDGNYSYLWDFGDGSPTSTFDYTYHTYTSAGSYTASVTMTNSCGADTVISHIVQIENNIPVTNADSYISPNSVCPNTEVYFDAYIVEGNNSAHNFLWDFGDGSPASNDNSTYHSYASVGSYQAWVKISNNCGNDTTLYQTVEIVNNIPVTSAYSYVSSTSVCPNTYISFEAYVEEGQSSDYTYLWDFGDGSPASNDPGSYHAYASLGSYTASVKITNKCGKDTILYHTVDVINNMPVTNVYSSVSPNSVCPNTEVHFNAWGDGNSFVWNFGDGSPTSNNGPHAYASLGSYTAWVTITNNCGNDTVLYQTVDVVNNIPVGNAYIDISPNPVCPNGGVSFAVYADAISYLWYFGDGNGNSESSSQFSSHSYGMSGSYPVSITLANACGNDTVFYETVDVINNLPVSNVGFDIYPNPACPNTDVSFEAWGDAVSFEWDFGDGSPVSTTADNYHKYTTLGSYLASVKMTNACGNDTILYQTVDIVNTIPVEYVNAYVSPDVVCPNDEVSFDAYSYNDNGYIYLWNFGDGSPAYDGQYPNHTYAAPGIYSPWVKITNPCGSDTTIYLTVQVVNNMPVTYIDYDISPNPVCPDDEVNFYAWGNNSYLWNFGDGSPTSTNSDAYHSYSAAGSYPASLKITNGCGNDTTVYETVQVSNNLPVTHAYFEISPNPVCPNDEVTFDAWGHASSYVMNFGDDSLTTNSGYTYHNYASIGSYDAWVKMTNSCGKDTTLYETVLVMNNIPVTDVSLSLSSNTVCPNDEVSFHLSGEHSSYTYEWNFGDGSPSSSDPYPHHSYVSAGTFPVSVKITNACGSDTILYGSVLVMNNLPVTMRYNYADFNVSPNPVCPNSIATFEVYANASSYVWDFGDGSPTSSDNYTEHSYPAVGSYPASVLITNGCGNDTTLSETVIVENNIFPDPQNYDYDVLQNEACPGDSITFYIQSGSGTYFWDFGDGTTAIQTTYIYSEGSLTLDMVNHSYSTPGNYTASFTMTNQCGNSFTDQFPILIGNNIPVNGEFWWNVDYPEVGEIIEFFGYGGSTYQVDYGDGTPVQTYTSSLTPIYHSYSSAGSYIISVTITNSCGNSQVYNDNINISGTVSLPDGAGTICGSSMACPGLNAVTYTVPSIAHATSYVWTLPAGVTGSSTTNSITVDFGVSAVSGNITVKGTNSLGDGAASILAISVTSNPVTPVVTSNGNILHSDATEGNQWFDQNGLIPGAVNQDYMVTTSGDYYVIVTLLGCSSEKSNIISKLNECDALFDFSWDGNVYFTDLSTGNPTAWLWDFGDGTFSSDQNPSHSYSKDGAYKVTLTILNLANNCIASVTKEVISGSVTCQAGFDFVINSVTGLTSFTSTSLNATGYYWDFGGGNYSIEANPEFTFTKAGFYSVCLTIWNSTTGCQSVSCKNIMFIPESEIYIQADFSFFTNSADNAVIFSDLSSSNTTNWYWTMGDGKVVKTQNPSYTYSKPGVYKVCLTVFDNVNSLSNSICKEVRVGEISCTIASNFTFFINPVAKDVAFFSQATGSVTDYFWTFGDGNSSTSVNPDHQYLNPGYYEVKLSVRNNSNKCVDEYSQVIQVGSVDCRADFTFRVDPNNNTVHFTDDSKGQVDYYYWDFGDGSFSVDQNPDNLYDKAGMYMVGQTVIDNTNGCIDFTFQPVQVGEVNCAAEFVTYIDSANFTAYYTNRVLGVSTALLWSFGDGKFSTEQNPVNVFPGAGIYSTGLNTYDFNNGCMDYYEEMLLIGGIGADCNADFAYLVDPVSSVVTFSNKSTGDVVGSLWNFGDESDNSTLTDPVHPYTTGGYYYVCLSVINTAGTKNMGCKWVLIPGNTAADCRANFMFTIDTSTRKVIFVNNSYGDINKYTWDFGDSRADSVSVVQHPEHTYDQKGYYLVQLKVENTTSGCVSNEYKLLNIAEAQVLKAAFGYEAQEPNKKIAGYPVDLVSASSGDGATVEWDFGDKQIKKESFTVMDSTSRIVTHYYQKPSKYRVCLRISDPVSGQSDEYCEWVVTKNAIGVYEISESGVNLDVYPNPFMNYTTISYALPKPQFIEIAVFDQLGRRIETLVKARKESGSYQIIWETKTLTTGLYHLKLVTADAIITKQLVITK